jgi:hypothetical protein
MSSEWRDPGKGSPARPPALDRAPGERYRAAAERSGASRVTAHPDSTDDGAQPAPIVAPGRRRAIGAALGVASAGALVVFVLGQVDVGAGLLAVAAAIGWLIALALVWGGMTGAPTGRRRLLVAVGFAAAAILVGFGLDWGWSRLQGGALDPLAYLDQRYGLLAWVNVAVAAAAAGLRGR